MTPLEAATLLKEKSTSAYLWDTCGGYSGCFSCDRAEGSGHEDDCPALMFPRILAALGAAEAVLWATDAVDSLPRSVVVALDDLEIALGEGQTSEVPA